MAGKREGDPQPSLRSLEEEARITVLVGESVCRYLEDMEESDAQELKASLCAEVSDPEDRRIVRQNLEIVDLLISAREASST